MTLFKEGKSSMVTAADFETWYTTKVKPKCKRKSQYHLNISQHILQEGLNLGNQGS